jgi:hypothetical protein
LQITSETPPCGFTIIVLCVDIMPPALTKEF